MRDVISQFAIPAAALFCAGAAAAFDLKSRRIPNQLTGPAMLAGLILHFCSGGGHGLLSSLGALLLCGLVFLVFHLAGGMGAGDVKLIAALGSILGLSYAPALLLFTALAGGALALAYTIYRGRLRETCGNVLALAAHHTERGLTPHPDLNVANPGTLRLPYALAIAAGCVLTLLLETRPVDPMNARRLLPALLVALVLSGLLTWLLSRRFAKPVAAAPVAVHRFVAAAKNLQAGEQIQPAMLTLADWPASQPLKGAFAKPEELTGRVLLFPIAAGEIVLDHHLAAPGSGTGLTAHIPEGMRAIALRSDEVAGVAGFLLPGTFVDVLVTYSASGSGSPMGSTGNLITSTVLQNAKVLTSGQKMEPDPSGKAEMASVVTLLVTPQDAEKLTLASSLGKILFVLRNGVDRKDVADLTPQTTLLGAQSSIAPPPAPSQPRVTHTPAPIAKPPYSVQIISGNKLTEATFERKEP